MHTTSDTSPETARFREEPGAGAGADATTAEQLLHRYTRASVAYLDAQAARHRADATMYAQLALAHRADPYLLPEDRGLLAATAEQRAENALEAAAGVQTRADELRRELPAVAAPPTPPMAIAVISIQRDRIQQHVRLLMGGEHVAMRTWTRVDAATWRSIDEDFAVHEDRIGIELAEFIDGIDLPSRVADMLPRQCSPDAARRAREEVCNAR